MNLKGLAKALLTADWYYVRRSFLWPEGRYKAGMIRRVQRHYRSERFVETGTYKGDTLLALRKHFKQLWSAEIHEGLHRAAAKRLRQYPNITCFHGSGESLIADIMPQLKGPTIFWLDSHYSGPGTGGAEDDMPVLKELDAIGRNYHGAHIVIIDDIASYSAARGHASLSSVISRLESIDPRWEFFFDYGMLFALPGGDGGHPFWRRIVYHWAIR